MIDFPKEQINTSLVDRFRKQVSKYGSNAALNADGNVFSYECLDSITDRISKTVSDLSRPIALLLPLEWIPFGIVSVLKSGACYIALDPYDSMKHNSSLVEDCGVNLVISCSSLSELRFDKPIVRTLIDAFVYPANATLCLDEASIEDKRSTLVSNARSQACLQYTSGTSGRPKGVMHTNQSLMHIIWDNSHCMKITNCDNIACISPPSVIGATAGVFRALLNGATVFPLDIKSGGALSLDDWLLQNCIDIVQMVPTTLRLLMNNRASNKPKIKVRVLLVVGESLLEHDIASVKQHFSSDTMLINEFGTTETGAISRLSINLNSQIHLVDCSVGEPASDKRISLRSQAGREVSTGEIGEIVVESEYLSSGYYGQDDLTAQVFIQTDTGVAYATGDLGRMDPSGQLIHLGRIDDSIKIHGRMVNPIEIESAILQTGLFRQVAVIAMRSTSNHSELVAFVTSDSVMPPSRQLRESMDQLPDYMIPARFLLIPSFPVSESGKINRKALESMSVQNTVVERQDSESMQNSSKLESELLLIWQECLGLPNVNRDDDIFDLGADSLQALQIITRLRERTGNNISLRELFDGGSIANLLAKISQSNEPEKTS